MKLENLHLVEDKVKELKKLEDYISNMDTFSVTVDIWDGGSMTPSHNLPADIVSDLSEVAYDKLLEKKKAVEKELKDLGVDM